MMSNAVALCLLAVVLATVDSCHIESGCQQQFTYKQKSGNKRIIGGCTDINGNGKCWCSLRSSFTEGSGSSEWKWCQKDVCPRPSSACVARFRYEYQDGNSVHVDGCTKINGDGKCWCSTTDSFREGSGSSAWKWCDGVPTKPVVKPSGCTSTLCSERKAVLAAHNKVRARHGSSPVSLDERINRVAQRYAQYLANTNSFQHSQGSGYGENLHMQQHSGSHLDVATAMDGLYWQEERLYNYNRPGYSSATGHFTAIVWRATTLIGVGIAKRRQGRSYTIYLVVNFAPAGNMQGQFRQNVRRP